MKVITKIFLMIGTAMLILFIILYIQYRNDINHAHQRVLAGSELLLTNEGEIEYAVEGEGTPVLLIHGAGGGYDQGLLMGKTFLGDGFQYISVSRFGYLRSPFLAESTVENQAILYDLLLEHLEIDKAIIFGVSAGGPSALQFAHDFPDRSSALVLVSAVSMFMGDEVPISTKVINFIQRYDFTYWLVLNLFKAQFLDMIGISKQTYSLLSPDDQKHVDALLEFMHPMSYRLPGTIHEATIRPLTGESMKRIKIPTIVVHAKDDVLVTYEHAEFIQKNMKHAELLSFKRGGHGLISELKTINKRIKDFLERNIPKEQSVTDIYFNFS
ncbi:alpha/beta hydrolase [Heliorestis acidaminivorans]|uniref:Alpha/beta hydrolase n=1 Tax=Heliorestis acidaminivorans TaxID=553427 RepID=A0A6I0EN65_9FIRM|nr:alpha/beta hydrolase [Heliorestis acidaminivorans]KAB2951070.1 alpha/beta hydrolase [Heliorestis acidaminivorans]